MRLDHLLSKEEEVGRQKKAKEQEAADVFHCPGIKGCQRASKIQVAMRLGDTPVPIPNTMVKTRAADGTMLETVWESRRVPDLRAYSSAG